MFGRPDPTYRRLERLSRSLVLAAEASGLAQLLSPEEREVAAIVAESSIGCVEIDRRYTRSLADEVVDAAIFPYTLPNTSLGEVALRHGLRGPTISMSVEDGDLGASLRETRRMLEAGEIRHALACSVDVLDEAAPGLPAGLRAVTAVIGTSTAGHEPLVAWPEDERDPFGVLAAAVR